MHATSDLISYFFKQLKTVSLKVVVFSSRKNIIQSEFEIQVLKFGYLLSDKICIAGQLAASLLFEREHQKFNQFKKFQFLHDSIITLSDDTENKELNLKTLEDFIETAKKFSTLRHPTAIQSSSFNTSKIAFNRWIDPYIKEIRIFQKKFGMTAIAELSDEKKIELKLLNISLGAYTYAKHESELNAKQILELIFPSKQSNESSILLIPFQFSISVEATRNPSSDNEEVANVKNYQDFDNLINHVFTMPDLVSMSAIQLKALNIELSQDFSLLNTKIDEWIRVCKTSNDLIKLNNYFLDNLIEPFTIMQEAIDRNQIIKDIRNSPDSTLIDNKIYFGLYPIEGLWNLYDQIKIVSTETVNYLKKRTMNNNKYPKYIPIINIIPTLIETSNTIVLNQNEEEEHLGKNHTKKFISID